MNRYNQEPTTDKISPFIADEAFEDKSAISLTDDDKRVLDRVYRVIHPKFPRPIES